MDKQSKHGAWITGVLLVFLVVALIIFTAVMWAYHWDFTKLSTGKYETNTYEISEAFSSLSMKTDTADITFVLSDDGKCKVECYEEEEEKAQHSVTVQEDKLVVKAINNKAWYDYIGIHIGTPKITVYLPKAEYTALSINEDTGDIKLPKDFKFTSVDIALSTGAVDLSASVLEVMQVKTSTGNICVENTSAGALDLSASTGRITVSNVTCIGDVKLEISTGKTNLTDLTCKNLISDGDTGDLFLKNVIATENFSIERSTGDVKFESSDAAEIDVETDTGDVTGSLLTDKVFITETDTGKIEVPKTVTGGKCEISTDTGDIKITILHP